MYAWHRTHGTGYATATSVILTGILSASFFGTSIDLHFMLAVINVTCSIALYSNLGAGAGGAAGGAIAPAAGAGGVDGLQRATLVESKLALADGEKQHA